MTSQDAEVLLSITNKLILHNRQVWMQTDPLWNAVSKIDYNSTQNECGPLNHCFAQKH